MLNIKSHFSNIIQIRWSVSMHAGIRDAWPLISNTDRINRSFMKNPIEYQTQAKETGGSTLYGKTSNLGITSEFKEYPYEWIENKFMGVYREFNKGVVRIMQYEMKIENKEPGFIAHFLLRVIPVSFLLKPVIKYELKNSTVRGITETFQNIDNYLRYHTGVAIPTYGFKPMSEDIDKFQSLKARLSLLTDIPTISEKICRYILDTPDIELLKMKPARISRFIQEDKKKVLEFFLRGTNSGVFDMNWDILCPDCKGSAASLRKLNELPDDVHCSSCNIDYGPDFDRNVEITFTPNPTIRTVIGGIFCMGGPGNTPHILTQLRVKQNSERIVELDLKIGTYRIFSPQKKNSIRIIVSEGGSDNDLIEYTDENGVHEVQPGSIKFIFINNYDYEISIKIEDAAYLTEIISASEITAMQEFRYQFSKEVLRKGQEISIKSISILFTDLKGSTAFYNQKGDTYAYKIVSDHFDILFQNVDKYNGAIVKTIGDAIMAVFIHPLDAIKYSFAVQAEVQKYNLSAGEEILKLKIGIHYGPSLVVNMNDRLDYFGTTVNLAARTEGQCTGNDIVITKKIYDIPEVSEYLEEKNIEFFESSLKGFNDAYSMVRIPCHKVS